MFANVDPIYVRQVIGDVVETISPCMDMKVYINGTQIVNGCTIKPSTATEAPQIRFEGQTEHLYTLVRATYFIYRNIKILCIE